VWSDGNGRCHNLKSTIDHGPNGTGFWRVQSLAERRYNTPWGPVDCTGQWQRPAGSIRNRAYVMKWANGRWSLCVDTGWVHTTGDHAGLDLRLTGGRTPPCGSGSYRTIGDTDIKIDGTWRGDGPQGTSSHSLPVS
jgi:hypothetical protein